MLTHINGCLLKQKTHCHMFRESGLLILFSDDYLSLKEKVECQKKKKLFVFFLRKIFNVNLQNSAYPPFINKAFVIPWCMLLPFSLKTLFLVLDALFKSMMEEFYFTIIQSVNNLKYT